MGNRPLRRISSRRDYLEPYRGGSNSAGRQRRENALSTALEIRKFEIDLYWRRATYFWAFVAAIFVGYAAVGVGDKQSLTVQLTLAVLGALFSLGWCLVNHGSKYWQSNWEAHVDILEDQKIGPLYKRILRNNSEAPAGTFSVSQVNLAISYIVLLTWLALLARSTYRILQPKLAGTSFENYVESNGGLVVALLALCSLASAGSYLIFCCRTQHAHTSVNFEERTTIDP